jgi:hypothetical protein
MTAEPQVTLLITNSIDYLADLLVARLGSERVFRYNTDLWRDYSFCFSADGVEISDPTGRSVTDANIAKVYRRSAMRGSVLFPQMELTDLERYAEEEVYAAWADLFNIFWHQGKIILSQPLGTLRSGKLLQLRIAPKYFEIVPYRFILNREDQFRQGTASVCKSFNFKYANGVGFYSSKVDEGALDPAQPWFLTDYIEATHDVTVAVVRTNCSCSNLTGPVPRQYDRLAPSPVCLLASRLETMRHSGKTEDGNFWFHGRSRPALRPCRFSAQG